MESKLSGFSAIDPDTEIDRVAIEYKLKMIAFQNEIFQARKRLSESDYRISQISENMDAYLRNKENQLAEVMLTARMNAQRIEVQARSQVEYFLLEMEEEAQKKQKDLATFEQKATEKGIALSDLRGAKTGRDNAERLTVVKDKGREIKRPVKEAVVAATPSPEAHLTQPEVISSPPPEIMPPETGRDEVVLLTELLQGAKPEVIASAPDDIKSIGLSRDGVSTDVGDDQASVAKAEDRSSAAKKRKVVGKKSSKSRSNQPEVVIDESPANLADIQEQVAGAGIETTDPALETSEASGEAAADEITAVASQDYLPEEDQHLEEVIYQPPAPMVPHETMRLDAFLDVRYYDQEDGKKQIQHHALQITVDVLVPDDNYAVRYTKVNSDIVSALLRYDNVILNEQFPFDFIAPNPQSIATYFYNYLEDILSMMDLGLQSITVLEIPDVQIQVASRNTAMDNMMHKDTDELVNLRASLRPCVEPEPVESTDLKGRLNKMFKKKN